ncbi:restriction endonuclease subunit S [Streptomyces sp. NPDC050658]|uniref:restriction endonuclease subunit S n=1 Tax=unclassified Streptomyces TaxID=2593676 RepID=UPI003446E751
MTEARLAPWLSASRWPTVPIRLVARLGSGHTPSRSKPEYWENCTVPWVTLADVWQLRNGQTDVIKETKEKISPLGLANSSAVKHPAGTVILSRTASVGFSAIMGSDMATSQDFATWTCGPKLEPRYLLHALRGMAPDLKRVAMGSTHKTIYMPDIEQLRVPLPPLEEQCRIAEFLDTETARMFRLNAALRKFDQDVRERERAVLARMLNADVAEVGGALPSGWRWTPLMRLTDPLRQIMYGIVLPGPNVPEGVPIVKGGDVAGNRLSLRTLNRTTHEIASGYARSCLVEGDLVIAIRGSVGEIAVVPGELNGANLTQDAARISIGSSTDAEWLRFVLDSPLVTHQIQGRITGATIKGINIWDLKRVLVPTPETPVQSGLVKEAGSVIATHEALRMRVACHSKLVDERRQALIAAAVTGQFDVSTASGRNVTDGVR